MSSKNSKKSEKSIAITEKIGYNKNMAKREKSGNKSHSYILQKNKKRKERIWQI